MGFCTEFDIHLHTADPGEAGASTANEATYTSYAVVTVNRSAAVWNAVAANYNATGSMGEKLNAAGTAGDPWTTDLSTYTTPGTAGKIPKENPAALEVINQNVQKASKLIPTSTDI